MHPSAPNPADQIKVFDRTALRAHRDRAAPGFRRHNALFAASAEHLLERLEDVSRSFSSVLDLGSHDAALAAQLAAHPKIAGPKITEPKTAGQGMQLPFIAAADLSAKLLGQTPPGVAPLAADEEGLPFADNSFDLIVSNLSLHWVNDLPGALLQIRRALRPGGLFLAALLGGETLTELRHVLMEAELSLTGGYSPRLSPTISLLTASGLLQRAGFELPVTDHEIFTLTYADALALMRDLRGMGETAAHLQRPRHGARRDLFAAAAALYQARYPAETGIRASFDVVFLHGWKPA